MQSRRSGKIEIQTIEGVREWLQSPVPAVFHRLDLSNPALDELLGATNLAECSFLGCGIGPLTAATLPRSGAFRIDALRGLLFDPFRTSLYTPTELYDRFDTEDPSSYETCFDRLVYRSVSDPETHVQYPVDVDVALMRRLHDAAIGEALATVLPLERRMACVAVMGGHDEPRKSPNYRRVVELTRSLTREGFVIATGGGPGIMEAANLGAYLAGFGDSIDDDPKDEDRLERVLETLSEAPDHRHENWLGAAFRTLSALGKPDRPQLSESFGIPTWFYGHEPPNVFATRIAKYFENSLREEGLLAIALGGVIFSPGNAGTVQEIFQDACQNYYRTYDNTRSPMILFGRDYWNGRGDTPNSKPVEELLRVLAIEKGFGSLILSTDDPVAISAFLQANRQHPPQA